MSLTVQKLKSFGKDRESERQQLISGFRDEGKILRVLQAWSPAVQRDLSISKELWDAGELVAFLPGEQFIFNGSMDDDAFILLHGTAQVNLARKNETRLRKAPVCVGEMAFRSQGTGRCADVIAKDEVVAIKMSGQDFNRIVRKCPELDLAIQVDLENRARESARSKPKNSREFGYYILAGLVSLGVFSGFYFGGLSNMGMSALIGACTATAILMFNPDHWMKRVIGMVLFSHVAVNSINLNTGANGDKFEFSLTSVASNGWDFGLAIFYTFAFLAAAILERK